MKTAEEFLINRLKQLKLRKRENLHQMSAYTDDITDAMVQYAKQEAIEFANKVHEKHNVGGELRGIKYWVDNHGATFSTNEVYDQFKNKDK